jgi:hypothetical protein
MFLYVLCMYIFVMYSFMYDITNISCLYMYTYIQKHKHLQICTHAHTSVYMNTYRHLHGYISVCIHIGDNE